MGAGVNEGVITGIDVVLIERLKEACENGALLKRVFTAGELDYSFGKRLPHRHLAGRFAAKEACLKAFGTGLSGLKWKDIEVVNAPDGAPVLRLYNRALELSGGRDMKLSIAYAGPYAFALVAAGGRIAMNGYPQGTANGGL